MAEHRDGGVAVTTRVLEARQAAGLTTKALADRLELSLWETERLERGELDAGPYLEAVAEATGRSREFFEGGALDFQAPESAPTDEKREEEADDEEASAEAPGLHGRLLVLASLVALVVVRFFTEVAPVLPRIATFVDIPIFLALCIVGVCRPHVLEAAFVHRRPYIVCGVVFLAVAIVSVLLNAVRVDLGPALVFLYGVLSPVVLFYAVYRLWPPGGSLYVSRVLVGLVVVQLAVAYGLQLPQYIATKNPDYVSGTFGENAYQLVFFLVVAIALLATIYTFEKGRLTTRFVPVMVIATIVITFLAQYRALLVTTGLAFVMVGVLLSRRSARGAVAAVVSSAALLVTLAFVAQNVPALKFGSGVEEVRANPAKYFDARLEVARAVGKLYSDDPRYMVTGTGPGTYSSRAWRAFTVDLRSGGESAASTPVRLLAGGQPYTTDVSEKYVVPQLEAAVTLSGSHAASSPYSSYISLMAEVGIIGFAALVSAYLAAFLASLRMTRISIRAAKPGDPLPALLCAATVAFFILPQMAILENWLEVTRVTFLSWILLAVATKEFDARRLET